MPTLAAGSYRTFLEATQITDRAGNPLGSERQQIGNFSIVAAPIDWTGSADNEWNNAANWDLERQPDATVVVLINAPAGTDVNVGGTPVRVQGIESFNAINLSTTLQGPSPTPRPA